LLAKIKNRVIGMTWFCLVFAICCHYGIFSIDTNVILSFLVYWM